jgi:ketosteroid isomerase-like protein
MARLSYAANVILLIILVVLFGFESRRPAAAHGACSEQVADSDAEQVSETFSRYIQAYEKKDLETLGKIFANDDKLQAFWPDPTNPFRIEGWKEVRRGLAGYLPAISSMTVNIRQPVVQVYGPLAILSCHWSFAAAVGGKPQIGSGRGTYVFEKRAGGWVIVHLHESSMPVLGK